MKTEKGVIIAAYKPGLKPRFIVLNRNKNWEGWELPKGHLENDDYVNTVKNELKEETSIDEDKINNVTDLEKVVEWTYQDNGEEVKREYKAYLVELKDDVFIDVKSNPHDEHSKGFFFRKEDALSLLTYEDHESVLEKASKEI